MTLVDEMINAQESTVVGYSEFMLKYITGDSSLHCFFEGQEDTIYYHGHIRFVHIGIPINPYRCGGKSEVLSVFSLITAKPEYETARTLYFIDRDFDDLVSKPEIYETQFYSIENLYSQQYCLEEFLTGHLGIPPGSPDFAAAITLFQQSKDAFYQLATPVNAYLRCYARKRAAMGSIRLNIDNRIDFKEGVPLSVNGFNLAHIPVDLAGIETTFKSQGAITQKEFDAEVAFLATQDLGQVGRGKFELQFMVHFLQRLKAAIVVKKAPLLSKPYTCKINISQDTFMSDFRSYAMVPQDLLTYISRN